MINLPRSSFMIAGCGHLLSWSSPGGFDVFSIECFVCGGVASVNHQTTLSLQEMMQEDECPSS